MMDWPTLWTLTVMVAMYALGKGIGRAQGKSIGRSERIPPLRLTIEVNGDPIGGVEITGMRMTEMPLSGPPPGHPENIDTPDP